MEILAYNVMEIMGGNWIVLLTYANVRNITHRLLMCVWSALWVAVAAHPKLSVWHAIRMSIGYLILIALTVYARMVGLEWTDTVLIVLLAASNVILMRVARVVM
jgi:hypothetical protein